MDIHHLRRLPGWSANARVASGANRSLCCASSAVRGRAGPAGPAGRCLTNPGTPTWNTSSVLGGVKTFVDQMRLKRLEIISILHDLLTIFSRSPHDLRILPRRPAVLTSATSADRVTAGATGDTDGGAGHIHPWRPATSQATARRGRRPVVRGLGWKTGFVG